MPEEKSSILAGVDVLAILGVDVQEDVTAVEAKRGLRRIFLKRAKECHPDKQKDASRSSDTNLEFARLKAAFDYLQDEEVFNTLYNRALHKKLAERNRKERSKGISSKQSQHLEALLRREQEAAGRTKPYQPREHSQPRYSDYQVDPRDAFSEFSAKSAAEEPPQGHGSLIVAARTMKIANESELNLLLLSDHFRNAFANFGMLRVEPVDIAPCTSQDVNVKVGIILFESHEHALKALLYYRNNRSKFRADLYALALGPQQPVTQSSNAGYKDGRSLDGMESVIFKRMKQAALKKRKLLC